MELYSMAGRSFIMHGPLVPLCQPLPTARVQMPCLRAQNTMKSLGLFCHNAKQLDCATHAAHASPMPPATIVQKGHCWLCERQAALSSDWNATVLSVRGFFAMHGPLLEIVV